MGAHIAERIALLGPFEGAGRDFEGFLEVGDPIQRFADTLFDVARDAQVIRVVTLVHIHRDHPVFFHRQLNDLIGLNDFEAHRLFSDDVRTGLQRCEDDLGVQVVRGGYGQDVEVGKIAQDINPRRFARVCLRGVSGPIFEILRGTSRRGCASGGDRHQLKLDWRQLA